jgi:hypothetical protein
MVAGIIIFAHQLTLTWEDYLGVPYVLISERGRKKRGNQRDSSMERSPILPKG